MIRFTPVLAFPEMSVGRFDHPCGDRHRDPPSEIAADYSVNLVEQGSFALETCEGRWTLRAGDVFVSYPGMEYRCSHDQAMPEDVCFTVACDGRVRTEEVADLERTAREHAILPPKNRLAYLFHVLASRRDIDSLDIEEAASAVMAVAGSKESAGQKPHGSSQLRWYAERVDAAREHMRRDYAGEQRLVRLARTVGMSPFHFARVFRELSGTSPHQFLLGIRLREAAKRLREGASVTEACYGCGFQNLSHFSRQFTRRFGVRPSLYSKSQSGGHLAN